MTILPDEEREPAEDESAHDDAQRPCCFVLAADFLKVFVFGGRRLRLRVTVLAHQQGAAVVTAEFLGRWFGH